MGCNIKYFFKKYYKIVTDSCAMIVVMIARRLHDDCMTVVWWLRNSYDIPAKAFTVLI